MIKKLIALPILCVIIVAAFSLMLWASLTDSGTTDELAHIPSGYSYMKYRDYRLNPEHPPLVKDLAGLPLTFMDLHFPTDHQAYTKDVNGQWWMGSLFLYESGNNPDSIIRWARIGPMLITLALIVLTYIWAAELIGSIWALFPAGFLAFSPIILTHGHYVTTDIGAAFGILLSIYLFVRYMHKPSRRRLVWAGIGFGIAQLMKFSAVLLVPHFLFIAFVLFLADIRARHREAIDSKKKWVFDLLLRHLGRVFGVFIIGFFVIWPVYAYHMPGYPSEKQRSDTESILATFAHGPDPSWEACKPFSATGGGRRMRCLADLTIWASDKPVLRGLSQYLLGVLMVIQRAAGGNFSYFFGEAANGGWWYYFPILFLTKEPIASLAALVIAIWYGLRALGRRISWHAPAKESVIRGYEAFVLFAREHLSEFAMGSFILLYWVYSVRSPLNIGIRHIIPTIPLMYILVWKALRSWMGDFSLRAFHKFALKSSIIGLFVLTLLVSTLTTAPLFLSSFNIFGGGNLNGYKIAVDSNYDWGQDLKRLTAWVDQRNTDTDPSNDVDKIAVDYFGAGSAHYYLGDHFVSWYPAKGTPGAQGIRYLAVSATLLQSSIGKLAPGERRKPEDEYSWLENPYQPYDRAGTSIFIYRFPSH